jgi:hypothetical protein
MRASILAAALMAAAALALGATGVQAAAGGNGPNSSIIHADCEGSPYHISINTRAGEFAAAHVVGGGTFVPTSFGETTIVITDENGTVTDTEPPLSKGSSSHNGGTLTCTYEFSLTEGGATVDISGSVTGFITPANSR